MVVPIGLAVGLGAFVAITLMQTRRRIAEKEALVAKAKDQEEGKDGDDAAKSGEKQE